MSFGRAYNFLVHQVTALNQVIRFNT
jgi:hypothetical protein